MADYDIAEAFRTIELELIASMKRNFKKHILDEQKEGFKWSMWQVEQLASLEEFKKKNADLYIPRFQKINDRALKVWAKGDLAHFFEINSRAVRTLINSTMNDLKQAEYAMLRKCNDEYRKIIFNAQTYFVTGSGSLKQAIDMASRDFLSRGINCVVYKDGKHVNIANYAEMSLRTTNKRVRLYSDGEKRKELGIHTVKVSSYGACSKLCQPWQGKVYIDDVYSGGSGEEAEKLNLPLLSTAIQGGLFHPNCKHHLSTYFPDDEDNAQKGKQEHTQEHAKGEQEHHYLQNKIQRERRLIAGSLDENNIREHKQKEQQLIREDEKYKGMMESDGTSNNIPKINDYQSTRAIDNAIAKLKKNKDISRTELTELFPKKMEVGTNPITDNKVYVYDKDMSYFIHKHVKEGSLNAEDLKNMSDVLDYDVVAKEVNSSGEEIGQIFIKKAKNRKGYFDAITKKHDNGEEIFHFQYRNPNNANRLLNRCEKKNTIIDKRKTSDNMKAEDD